ncbi:VWA domain-containing protein [Pelagibacterium montanilacus]|uniref:VWA domain-containing protein n=1 Tax=Pelagibacterium montanilacus TaxID=2185280 RepID=UPI000F8DE472|nr:VWA domain-containing protein [Pelagibacterium montanilacus]
MAERTPTRPGKTPERTGQTSGAVADFLGKVGAMTQARGPAGAGRGRLLFALDATMSRQPTWDLACQLQAEMFQTVADTGGLDVQLLYFRGFGECRTSRWVANARALADLMGGIACRGGHTQISKVFSHARNEHKREKVNAVVYVGDAMEEDVDRLAARAGELGLLGCPVFLFQEGRDPVAERAFREFARLTKGAYARFDSSAPAELSALLRAVAAYAAGGRKALQLQGTGPAKLLLEQLK